jgi:ribosomal protein S18 acetylase RimI-like enzyme
MNFVDLYGGKEKKMILIRDLSVKTRTPLIGAYRDVFSDPPWCELWSEEKTAEVVDQKKRSWQVAYDEALPEIVLGFCSTITEERKFFEDYLHADLSCLPGGRYGYLADIGVRREFRVKSLGKILWQNAEKKMKSDGVRGIILRVHREAVTHDWFIRLGYTVAYTYTDSSDRVILALILS